MSLTGVKMSEEVWLTCVTHAFSTETEEIMGLLLGDIEYSKSGKATALIWGASPQTRSDRRKDRVETNPEQLAAASALAERMSSATGRRTRVIGWYHSHPHITVLPSHVDVRTQAMYQLLDSGFIGLIFSCFNEDALKVGRIQVIAFQSLDGKQSYLSKPVSLSPVHRSTVIDVESSLSSDDASTRLGSGKSEKAEQDTGDSRSAVMKVDSNFQRPDRVGGKFHPDNVGDAFVNIDAMDMSDGMQEAMHRSHLDMSGAEYIRKEIPLHVLPALSLLKLDSPLASFTDLQRVLYEEEKAAYNQAISQNMRDGKVHPLTFIHHTSTYQASMCKLMEYCLTPAIEALEDRLQENEIRLGMLSEESKVLEAEASRVTEGTIGSPHRVDGLRGSPSRGHSFNESMNARSPASPGSRSKKGY
uniref:MPN domain-containing protein n=1 Tax=Opuntia streptacantha TaxID=393608 RepID=A0A7C8YQC3_OPUST